MKLNYYKNGDSVLATIAKMDLPIITKDEYDDVMNRASQNLPDSPVHTPTTEERLAALEAELAATKILLGVEP